MANLTKILIVGAGPAGLALVRACKDIAHVETTLIENKSHEDYMAAQGMGICLPFSAMDSAKQLGFAYDLVESGEQAVSIEYQTHRGERLSYTQLNDVFPNKVFLGIRRDKLMEILLKDQAVRFDVGVAKFEEQEGTKKIVVTFTNGDEGEYDLVVLANGARSKLREDVFGEDFTEDLGAVAFRFLVNRVDGLPNHPVYGFPPDDDTALMVYPVSETQSYVYGHKGDKFKFKTATAIHDPQGHLRTFFKDYKYIDKVVNNITSEIHVGRLMTLSQPVFRKQGKRFLCVGDACHVCSPALQGGVDMAFEDALEFADKIRKLPNNLDRMLDKYVDVRQKKVEWMMKQSNGIMKLALTTKLLGSKKLMYWGKRLKLALAGKPLNVVGWQTLQRKFG